MLRIFWSILILFAFASAAAAQPNPPGDLVYGGSVSGTITDSQYFGLWRFDGLAGDPITISMAGAGGLAPQIGLLTMGGDLIASSEEGTPDGAVSLSFTLEADGLYTIVATRAGRENGSTQGSYTLSLMLSAPDAAGQGVREVVFRCREDEAAVAAVIQLGARLVVENTNYRINVYGLDGFQPVVRVTSTRAGTNYCLRGSRNTLGDIVMLPGEQTYLIDENASQATFELEIDEPFELGEITFTIGSAGSAPGRYLAVITGLAIDPAYEIETVLVRVGPLAAAQGEVSVYALGLDAVNSRLDPYVRLLPNETGCDDAGRRGCTDVVSMAGAGLRLADEFSILGDRFDAGVRLRQDDLDVQEVEITSFSGNTSGPYALVLIGTLPPR